MFQDLPIRVMIRCAKTGKVGVSLPFRDIPEVRLMIDDLIKFLEENEPSVAIWVLPDWDEFQSYVQAA